MDCLLDSFVLTDTFSADLVQHSFVQIKDQCWSIATFSCFFHLYLVGGFSMISSAVGNLYLFKIFLILAINGVSKSGPIPSSHSKIFLSIEFSSHKGQHVPVNGSVLSSMYTAADAVLSGKHWNCLRVFV